MLADVIILRSFFQGCRHEDRFIQKFRSPRHGIPEESADATGHIDPGAAQFGKGNGEKSPNPAASGLPEGADTQKVQDFCNTLTVASHIGAGPEDDTYVFRIVAFF